MVGFCLLVVWLELQKLQPRLHQPPPLPSAISHEDAPWVEASAPHLASASQHLDGLQAEALYVEALLAEEVLEAEALQQAQHVGLSLLGLQAEEPPVIPPPPRPPACCTL